MPITREGKFLVTHDLAHIPCLGLESDALSECIKAIRDEAFNGVFGSSPYGFRERTLDALLEVPWLEAIWFWDVDLTNVDAIYSLEYLRFFGVHPKRPAIDFSRLKRLKRLEVAVWFHKVQDRGMGLLTLLKRLHVWHFNPKSASFSDLELPNDLNELQLNWANPTTLRGLRAISELRKLEIHRCRNLEDISLIPDLFPRLEDLVIHACSRVSSVDGEMVAKRLPSLKQAFVNDRKIV